MSYTQHYIIEGKLIGSSPREGIFIHGIPTSADSIACFCPVCAEVWARCPVIADNGKVSFFQVCLMPCRLHSFHGSLFIPGSLLLPMDKAFNTAWLAHEAAVRWEFQVHMAAR